METTGIHGDLGEVCWNNPFCLDWISLCLCMCAPGSQLCGWCGSAALVSPSLGSVCGHIVPQLQLPVCVRHPTDVHEGLRNAAFLSAHRANILLLCLPACLVEIDCFTSNFVIGTSHKHEEGSSFFLSFFFSAFISFLPCSFSPSLPSLISFS